MLRYTVCEKFSKSGPNVTVLLTVSKESVLREAGDSVRMSAYFTDQQEIFACAHSALKHQRRNLVLALVTFQADIHFVTFCWPIAIEQIIFPLDLCLVGMKRLRKKTAP